jgi:hypothetical protein
MLINGINSIEENGKEVEAFVLPLAQCGRQYNVNVSLYLPVSYVTSSGTQCTLVLKELTHLTHWASNTAKWTLHGLNCKLQYFNSTQKTHKLRGLSPRANYADRATAACRQS